MLFPEYSMGKDNYYLYQHEDHKTMNSADFTSFNGQLIGAVKDNLMTDCLEKWIAAKKVNLKLVYYDGFTERDQDFKLHKLDGIVATDNNILFNSGYSIVSKVGEDPYYLTVTKAREDLLEDLNYSLEIMAQMNPYFVQNLMYTSYESTLTNVTKTQMETEWVKNHDSLTLGYMDNYIPFCGTDKNGDVTGLIKDVIKAMLFELDIEDTVKFKYKKYDSYQKMLEGIRDGECDIVFPVGGNAWDQEQDGIDATAQVVSAGMNLIYKGKYNRNVNGTFAINVNNKLQYYYVKNAFPNATIKEYKSIEDCIEAVFLGEVDYTVVNGLRIDYVRNNSRYNNLAIMQLQKKDSRAIGVKHGDAPLLLLMNRGLRLIGSDYGSNASYAYFDQNKTVSFRAYLQAHIGILLLIIAMIVGFIILIFVLYIKGIKKTQEKLKYQLEKNRKLTKQLSKSNLEMEKVNAKLQAAKEEAESANHSKTDFLNNMSHDIRTPMNAILGYAKLMENKKDDPKMIGEYLEKMEKSGNYLLEIINNILEVARIDSGKMTIDNEFVDLTDPDCSVYPLLENEIKKKNLEFSCHMIIDHQYVFIDMAKIREINMNIMSNAIKYTPEGGKIHLHFEEVPCEREGYARYINTISDTGIGMSLDFQKKIFDSFTRERNSTESKVMGTGLGMSIVKKLVDLLDGTIEVKSELGKGTTFRVIMDHQIVEDPDSYIKNQQTKIETKGNLQGKKILLAEDNELNAEIATALLEEFGIDVEHAEDGISCFDKLTKNDPGYYDLILMDVQMPNLNGYETTEKIRQAGYTIPIVAMTANAFEEDRQNALNSGMNAFVSKPIDINKLMETLTNILE